MKESPDMLQGNINRMYVTHDVKELMRMNEIAIMRIQNIYSENYKRIEKDLKKKPTLTTKEIEVVKALILLGEEKIRRTYANRIITINESGGNNYGNETIQAFFAFIKVDESFDLKELVTWGEE